MGKELVVEQTGSKVFRGVFIIVFGFFCSMGSNSQKMVDVDALDLCHMNGGGQNHVAYYQPEKSSGGSARREERRGRNVMDKGSNEAGKGDVVRERRGKKEAMEEGGRERRACRRVERRRVGGSEGMCLAPDFSHAPSVLVCLKEAAHGERWKVEKRGMKAERRR